MGTFLQLYILLTGGADILGDLSGTPRRDFHTKLGSKKEKNVITRPSISFWCVAYQSNSCNIDDENDRITGRSSIFGSFDFLFVGVGGSLRLYTK